MITDREQYPGSRVLTTIIARKGSAPQGVGIKMLVCRDRRCIGTIGGGCMEAEVVQKAFRMMTGDGPEARVCHVDLSGTDAQEEGMVCGGTVDVLLEMV